MNTLLRKSVLLPALFTAISSAALAQQQNESSPLPLEILKLKWERQVQLPRNFDPSTIPMSGVFNDANVRNTVNPPTNPLDATRAATSAQSSAATASVAVFPRTPAALPVFYIYSMKVKNTGGKTIEGVAWDYVFLDVATNKEVGRHQFLSFEKLPTEKIVTFRSRLRSPPTRVVPTASEPKQHPKYTGKAIIQCVLYADDTRWRGPQAPTDICALLKTQRDLRRKKHVAA